MFVSIDYFSFSGQKMVCLYLFNSIVNVVGYYADERYTIPFSFLFYLNNVIVYLTRYNIILPGETSDVIGCKIINRKGQSATFKGASNSECGRNASGRQQKENS